MKFKEAIGLLLVIVVIAAGAYFAFDMFSKGNILDDKQNDQISVNDKEKASSNSGGHDLKDISGSNPKKEGDNPVGIVKDPEEDKKKVISEVKNVMSKFDSNGIWKSNPQVLDARNAKELDTKICTIYNRCASPNNIMQITDLSDVGCHYLKEYLNKPNDPNHLKWGNDIVKLILNEKFKNFNRKDYELEQVDQLVWSIGLFCIMFEYVSDKREYDNIKKLCDEFIVKLVPNIVPRRKHSSYFESLDFHSNTLRMMTNYLYRKDLYDTESNDPEIIEFNKQIKDASSDTKHDEVKFRYEIYLPLIKK